MLMAAESIVMAYIVVAPRVVEDVDGGGEYSYGVYSYGPPRG